MTHPQLLPEQNQKFLPFAVVPTIRDTSQFFSLSSDMAVRAALNENDKVLNRKSRANDVELYLD
jgi:hypothetical protein